MNRYLRDRADRRRGMRDSRSRGRTYDQRYDRESDYRSDYHYGGRQMPRMHERPPRNDYRSDMREYDYGDYNYDYGSDYRGGSDYGDDDEEYKQHIKKLVERLKHKDRFNLPKQEVIARAKKMGVTFDQYDEEEFYLVYLMMVTDYVGISQEPHAYIAMAKQWLEDDDVMRKGSEKLCAYIYEIVLGEQ